MPKAPKPTKRLRPQPLDQQDVITTLRRILAATIRKHGVLDTLTLTRAEIEAVKDGELKVGDDQHGNIRLILKTPSKVLVM